MLTLALETSSAIGSVALLNDETCVAEKTFGARERHSSDLVPAVQKILAKAKVRADQVDLWVVGVGPGSFVGIRVGIAAAKGFALATGKPLVGVASFHAIALEHLGEKPLLDVSLDAGRGEIYRAHYERGSPILETPIQLLAAPSASTLRRSDALRPIARFVAQLGREKFLHQKQGDEILEPIYLRETQFKLAKSPLTS